MIAVAEIGDRARKLWSSGRVLAAEIDGDNPFPFELPFGKPTAADWLHRYAEIRAWVAALKAGSRAAQGLGYTLELRQIERQKLGLQEEPSRIVFESAEDLACFIGERETLNRFRQLRDFVLPQQPALAACLRQQPMRALLAVDDWPRLLAVIAAFQRRPRPGCYLRELDIEGVDSKFIERNLSLLRPLLDACLPPQTIDAEAGNDFERRYGLRSKPALVRLRTLDPSCVTGWLPADVSLPIPDFVQLRPPFKRVFVTENEINFLTFPAQPLSVVIWGRGYAAAALGDAPWLHAVEVFYWGDLDTHGFAILSRLRQRLPQVRSLLMDEATLLAHRSLWGREPAALRDEAAQTYLTAGEREVYSSITQNRDAEAVRLEQEHIPLSVLQDALAALPTPSA